MKDIRLFVFVCLGLGLVFSPARQIEANAPTTAKIVFASTLNVKAKGGSDIYIMNPDGSGQVNLTRHKANSVQITRDGSSYGSDWFDPAFLPVEPHPQLQTATWGEIKSD